MFDMIIDVCVVAVVIANKPSSSSSAVFLIRDFVTLCTACGNRYEKRHRSMNIFVLSRL